MIGMKVIAASVRQYIFFWECDLSFLTFRSLISRRRFNFLASVEDEIPSRFFLNNTLYVCRLNKAMSRSMMIDHLSPIKSAARPIGHILSFGDNNILKIHSDC